MFPKALLWTIYIVYNIFLFYLIYRCVRMTLGVALQKPWRGYSMDGIRYVAQHFAVGKRGQELKIMMESPRPDLGRSKIADFLMPVAGAYFPTVTDKPQELKIDTCVIRSEVDLIHTLLHEICHHNQHMQGRLHFGNRGFYWFQPCEREARAFSNAWLKTALKMYRYKKDAPPLI